MLGTQNPEKSTHVILFDKTKTKALVFSDKSKIYESFLESTT